MYRMTLALAAALALGAGSSAIAQNNRNNNQNQQNQKNQKNQNQNRPMRFAAMDQNNDGRITRAEWRGSAQSFKVHDWNGDNVLTGEEVRPDGQRANQNRRDPDFDSVYREYEFDDWTARGFSTLDHNNDGRITRDEWHFDREGFRRADHNNDGVLMRAEFLSTDADDDRDDRFPNLDANNDGRVDRDEWHGSSARFESLDTNRDGILSRSEALGTDAPQDLFTSLDVNRDRAISRNEWHWNLGNFDQRDQNRDGRLTRAELEGPGVDGRSTVYRTGYQRGQLEGRQAGREDRDRRQEWDIEGQREMQSADSGYTAKLGSRTEYQAGYREGFRRAYPEGFRGQSTN